MLVCWGISQFIPTVSQTERATCSREGRIKCRLDTPGRECPMNISMSFQGMCSSISQMVRHELRRFNHGMCSMPSAAHRFFHL